MAVASPFLVRALLRAWRGLRSTARGLPERPFSEFLEDASAGRLAEVIMADGYIDVKKNKNQAPGRSSSLTQYRTRPIDMLFNREALLEQLTAAGVKFAAKSGAGWKRVQSALLVAIPFVYLGCLYYMVRQLQNPKDSVGKRARRHSVGSRSARKAQGVTFNDVAGVDAAKAELLEVVDFLRDSERFRKMGARMPKGLLLAGPAGTGKTMLARAMANEVGAPFLVVSASEFVETLVGRGAARVRDLFKRARDQAPAIIFIDEVDSLGRARGLSLNSNEEREQTLNQILTEMDGFDSSGSSAPILVIAATNRPQVLDPALLRPGRFDRHVYVGLPDVTGREAILASHARRIRMDSTVDLSAVARSTAGFSGADLANVVNEAALLAVRAGASETGIEHFNLAVGRHTSSNEKRNNSVGFMGGGGLEGLI